MFPVCVIFEFAWLVETETHFWRHVSWFWLCPHPNSAHRLFCCCHSTPVTQPIPHACVFVCVLHWVASYLLHACSSPSVSALWWYELWKQWVVGCVPAREFLSDYSLPLKVDKPHPCFVLCPGQPKCLPQGLREAWSKGSTALSSRRSSGLIHKSHSQVSSDPLSCVKNWDNYYIFMFNFAIQLRSFCELGPWMNQFSGSVFASLNGLIRDEHSI